MGANENAIDTTGLYLFASVSLLMALFKLMGAHDWSWWRVWVPVQQRPSARLGCQRRRPMTKRQDRNAIYVKRQFDAEIIVLCVRWYITYRLSYRDLVAMMAERGVILSHTTIMR